MELSRRDAFRPCSRDSSGDKVNFVLLVKKKQTFFSWNGPPPPPLPSLGYIYLPVEYGFSKAFRLQLTNLHYEKLWSSHIAQEDRYSLETVRGGGGGGGGPIPI